MIQVRAGSAAAFEVIAERYWLSTARYAHHMVGDQDQAADIAQEAFVRLWQRRGEWEPAGSVRVWLFRTARNLAASDGRRKVVRMRWAEGGGREDAPRPDTPMQELERAELRAAIEGAVRSLPARRSEVFTLFHIENLSYREIAAIMEIRPQTVANYLQAALADLRRLLAPHVFGMTSAKVPHQQR
jgi:RNA polymerase sigma-70 factor, ECF subfamily